MYYKLDENKNVVSCKVLEWAVMFEQDRCVASTQVGDYRVSTVFLGLDHSFDDGPLQLFETMVFDKDGDDRWTDRFCHRYATWDEADLGHGIVVAEMEEIYGS